MKGKIFMAENYYTLNFDLDGGTGNFPDITGEEGFGFTLPSEIPVKIGYTFVCWQMVTRSSPGDHFVIYLVVQHSVVHLKLT